MANTCLIGRESEALVTLNMNETSAYDLLDHTEKWFKVAFQNSLGFGQ